jgi:hypothetical protein
VVVYANEKSAFDLEGALADQGHDGNGEPLAILLRPGTQLRFTDVDRHRFTAFATDAKRGQLLDVELRHRRRTIPCG